MEFSCSWKLNEGATTGAAAAGAAGAAVPGVGIASSLFFVIDAGGGVFAPGVGMAASWSAILGSLAFAAAGLGAGAGAGTEAGALLAAPGDGIESS